RRGAACRDAGLARPVPVAARRARNGRVEPAMSMENSLPISHRQRLWLYALGGLVMLFLIAPSVIIVIMSFSGSSLLQFPPQEWSLRWYESYFGSLEWRDATIVSVKVAVI